MQICVSRQIFRHKNLKKNINGKQILSKLHLWMDERRMLDGTMMNDEMKECILNKWWEREGKASNGYE